MSPPLPASLDRDTRVDWLRGFAALLVLVHHLFAPLEWDAHPVLAALDGVAAWTWLGVPIFFVLSGRCVGQAWLQGGSAVRFAVRRLRRIYPPYFASLLVCLGAVALHKLVVGVNDVTPLPGSPAAILATLALATAPATTIPTMNWVYWSLTCEVAFYALLAGLLLITISRHRLRGWLGLHGLLCLLDLLFLATPATPGFFLAQWSLFGLGVGLALLAARSPVASASLALTALHLAALVALGRADATHLVGLATAGALLLPMQFWPPLALRQLPRIGVISYSLYLIHVPVGVHLILPPLAALFGPGVLGLSVALTLAALGSLAAAFVFHRVAERPWMTSSSRSPASPST